MNFYWEIVLMLVEECGSVISKCLLGINVYIKEKFACTKYNYHFRLPISNSLLLGLGITYPHLTLTPPVFFVVFHIL